MQVVKQGDDVYWKGSDGYRGKGFMNGDKIALQKCPKDDCGGENYALNVLSGICTWCGFNANEVKNDHHLSK